MDNYQPNNTNENYSAENYTDNYAAEQVEYQAEPEVYAEEPKKAFPVLGLISMICGILSVLGGCCCFGITAIPAIAAIILTLVEKSKRGKMSGMALAGLICGIVGVVIAVGWLVYWILSLIGIVAPVAIMGGSTYYY